jgi:hypothetical protein
MISIAYPVELGIRLRQLVLPVILMYADAFDDLDADSRATMEEFVVSCKFPWLLQLLFLICHSCVLFSFPRSRSFY